MTTANPHYEALRAVVDAFDDKKFKALGVVKRQVRKKDCYEVAISHDLATALDNARRLLRSQQPLTDVLEEPSAEGIELERQTIEAQLCSYGAQDVSVDYPDPRGKWRARFRLVSGGVFDVVRKTSEALNDGAIGLILKIGADETRHALRTASYARDQYQAAMTSLTTTALKLLGPVPDAPPLLLAEQLASSLLAKYLERPTVKELRARGVQVEMAPASTQRVLVSLLRSETLSATWEAGPEQAGPLEKAL